MADQGEKGLRGLVMISLILSALTLAAMAGFGVLALSKLGSVSESKKEVKVIEQSRNPGRTMIWGPSRSIWPMKRPPVTFGPMWSWNTVP